MMTYPNGASRTQRVGLRAVNNVTGRSMDLEWRMAYGSHDDVVSAARAVLADHLPARPLYPSAQRPDLETAGTEADWELLYVRRSDLSGHWLQWQVLG